MTLFQPLLNDLREKRLWPVVLVLLGALVAVPVLLAKPAPKTPPAAASAAPNAIAGGSTTAAVPVVSMADAIKRARLRSRSRDPFDQQQQQPTGPTGIPGSTTTPATPSGSTGTTPTTGSGSSGTSTAIGGSTGSSPGTSTTGGTGTGGTGTSTPATGATPFPVPLVKPKPAPSGLTATESYDVTLAITNSSGGLDSINPLRRLSVLPNMQQPVLVELGVLKGGHRVLFAVQPGAVLSGPGQCLPGRIDCQLLSLGVDQVEGLALRGPIGVAPLAEFAVTAIKAAHYKSAAAARKARRSVSAAGQRLLRGSKASALSLFPYRPSVGAIVDRRNLTVRGK